MIIEILKQTLEASISRLNQKKCHVYLEMSGL